MSTMYLEWGGDFVVTPNGSLQWASGWDEVRQRIERRIITNPLEVLPSGEAVPPDYIFDTNYGLGYAKLVNQNLNNTMLSTIKQRAYQGVTVDDAVSGAYPPQISLYSPIPGELILVLGVTLKTGEQGQIAISSSSG